MNYPGMLICVAGLGVCGFAHGAPVQVSDQASAPSGAEMWIAPDPATDRPRESRTSAGLQLAQAGNVPRTQEKLSSAEQSESDGTVSAYGEITDVGLKQGYRYLNIDYGEWLSPEACRRRVAAGTIDLDSEDCEIDALRYVNQNPLIREFRVADDVDIQVLHPGGRNEHWSWERFSRLWRARSEDTREFWGGLWQIHRRGQVVERIDWVFLP